jgi:hypothetical protein
MVGRREKKRKAGRRKWGRGVRSNQEGIALCHGGAKEECGKGKGRRGLGLALAW